MPYFSIAMRSGPIPNANPEYSAGSYPTARSTFGCTIPAPRISSQSPRHSIDISTPGSTNGK